MQGPRHNVMETRGWPRRWPSRRGAGPGLQPWCLPGSHSNAELRVQAEGHRENKGATRVSRGRAEGRRKARREMVPHWAPVCPLEQYHLSLSEKLQCPKERRQSERSGGGRRVEKERSGGEGWRGTAGTGVQGAESVPEPPAHC